MVQMQTQMSGDPFLHTRAPYRSLAEKDKSSFLELYENAAYASLAGQRSSVVCRSSFIARTRNANSPTTRKLTTPCRLRKSKAGLWST